MTIDSPSFSKATVLTVGHVGRQGDSSQSRVTARLVISPSQISMERPTASAGPIVLNRRAFLRIPDISKSSASLPFAKMTPRGRVIHLINNRPGEIVFFAIGLVGSIYVLLRALVEFLPEISVISKAFAQDSASILPILSTNRDAFDWMVGAVMSIAFLISLFLTFFANNDKKIDLGSGMAKLLAGFLAGFLTSKSGA